MNGMTSRPPVDRRAQGESSSDTLLDAILAARDFDDMAPTLRALEHLATTDPDHARTRFEWGTALAMTGDEAGARDQYEAAMADGLSGEPLRRCLVRYATVLHVLGEEEASEQIVGEVRRRFAGPPAKQIFDAIALHTSGRKDEAFSSLLEILADMYGVDQEEDRYRTTFMRTLASPD